jgi:hypothetical protein
MNCPGPNGSSRSGEEAARVSVTLVEVLPELVERARSAAAEVAADVEVLAADAGCSETYVGLGTVPADVVLLVGVLGNISDADVAVTVTAMPRLCARGPRCCGAEGAASRGPTTSSRRSRGILRRRVGRGVYPFIRRRGGLHGARR